MNISIVMPAKNEGKVIGKVIAHIKEIMPDSEVIVVNDGSTDDTKAVAEDEGAIVVTHPYSKGNGAAIKTGARKASGDVIVFMDADGQHRPEEIPLLLKKIDEGFDLAVGARDKEGQASKARWLANTFYNELASWVVERPVADLTSGFRAVKANLFREFLDLLPNGFSYPTTSTMAFFRAGYSVAFVPIDVKERVGSSHINLTKDGVRFLIIIFKICTLYSPLKLFTPISFMFAGLGFFEYLMTYIMYTRFSNLSVILFIAATLVFLIGLVSEQITTLLYKDSNKNDFS